MLGQFLENSEYVVKMTRKITGKAGAKRGPWGGAQHPDWEFLTPVLSQAL